MRGTSIANTKRNKGKTAQQAVPPPGLDPEPLSTEQLIAGAHRLHERLGRHLDASEKGQSGAIDDIAAVLRTTLARGKGDDVVRRLCKQAKVAQPQVLVTKPTVDSRDVIFEFGGLPASPPEDEDSQWIDVGRWASGTALIITGGRPRKNTWEQVITHYANTFGSHMGVEVPYALSAISLMSTMIGDRPLTLGEHLIHCAGIVAEDALAQVLTEVDGQRIVVPSSRRRVLSPITRLFVSVNPSGLPRFQVILDKASAPKADDVVLFRAKIEGHYYRIATADAIGELTRVNSTMFSVPVLKRALGVPPWWDGPDDPAAAEPPPAETGG